MRRTIILAAALAMAAAACGGSDGDAAPETMVLTVHTVAEMAGLGSCLQSPVNGADTLVVKDASGTVVASTPVTKTPGADACNWMSTATVPVGDFYALSTADGVELVTVPASAIDGGRIELVVNVLGDVKLG